jgi:hypothetical protein
MARIPLRFNIDDAQLASDTWGMNCGPAALGAIMGLRLDEVRPHMGDFERKHYTNPTLMFGALKSLGATFHNRGERCDWPVWGLARIQWEGPWTKPGVPIRARYRHTHWVGVEHPFGAAEARIFDVNCICVGGWVWETEWTKQVVPWLLKECVPRASGGWHVTHHVEVEPPVAVSGVAA